MKNKRLSNPVLSPQHEACKKPTAVASNSIAKRRITTVPDIPDLLYDIDSEVQTPDRIEENKGKSGVYRVTRLRNGDSYVGSSEDMEQRSN